MSICSQEARTPMSISSPRMPRLPALLPLPVLLPLILGAPVPGSGQERPPSLPALVQPGAPGEESRRLTPEELVAPERPRHTEADVRFMQNMIHHHEQALIMSRMAPHRTDRWDLLTLAARIERAQGDEIRLMARWLELRHESVPPIGAELDGPAGPGHPHGHDHPGHEHHHGHQVHDAHGHHGGEHPGHDDHGDDPLMAGMLTPDQLQELSEARGETFDRLFLEFMIHHHEGAIQMVDELFRSPGSARDSEIFHFATDVANDQLGEIARMRVMLAGGR